MTAPKKMRERIYFGAAPRRLPFALRDLREAVKTARALRPQNRFLLGLLKQITRAYWPTDRQLESVNAIFAQLDMPPSKCPTREQTGQARQPSTEPTAKEILAQDCAALEAVQASRPLKPPPTVAVYEPIPSEVLKLRARQAHTDRDGFRETFLLTRRS